MLRPWQTKIWLSRKNGESIYTTLSNQIAEDICSGRLAPGHMMPGSRSLALQLGINRKTVQQVYEELESQGWLVSKPRQGTYVADMLPELSLSCENQELVGRAQGASSAGCSFEGKLLSSHHIMGSSTIYDGVPDTRLIPFELLSRAFRRAIVQTSRQPNFGYGDPKGTEALRQSLQRMLNMDRFMNVTTDQICVVRGSQMGIYLSSKVLDPAKGVLVVECLSYSPAVSAFESNGFNVVRCRQDERGLDIEDLEKILSCYQVAGVYTTPHHQYPTTVSLSMDRRLKLLKLSKIHGFAVLEDDYDHEFHYESRPIPPLASLPNSENVVHIGSLSKVFVPGLRLGYVVASSVFINRIAEEITLIDRQGSTVTELAVADLMQSGDVKKHIRKVRKIYQVRRDHAASELQRIFSDKVSFCLPPGGLALWIDISQLLIAAGGNNSEHLLSHLPVLSGSKLFTSAESIFPTHARFGFGALTESEITLALEQFAEQLM